MQTIAIIVYYYKLLQNHLFPICINDQSIEIDDDNKLQTPTLYYLTMYGEKSEKKDWTALGINGFEKKEQMVPTGVEVSSEIFCEYMERALKIKYSCSGILDNLHNFVVFCHSIFTSVS